MFRITSIIYPGFKAKPPLPFCESKVNNEYHPKFYTIEDGTPTSTCGNGICDSNEDSSTCSQDCPITSDCRTTGCQANELCVFENNNFMS